MPDAFAWSRAWAGRQWRRLCAWWADQNSVPPGNDFPDWL